MAFSLSLVAGVLAAVFAVSGVAKVRRPYGAALTLRRFGITRGLAPKAGRAVGVVELLAAVTVATLDGWWAGYLPAALLLAVFTGLVARSVARGERFPCHCFGEHGGDLSIWSVVRTGGLLVLALAAMGVATRWSGAGVEVRVGGECAGVCSAAGAFLIATLRRVAPFSSELTDA